MKIYDILQFPVPLISYCVLHQARKDVEEEEYVRTMRQLHERVKEESEKLAWTFQNENDEARAKTVELIKSRLRPFLQTPIKSDEEEVGKFIDEGLVQLSAAGLGRFQVGLKWSAEGRIIPVRTDNGTMKRMARDGKEYLASLGLRTDKNAGKMFESVFLVDGGLNLDILEHIVRDRLGIYSMTHGQHLLEFDNVIFSSFNAIVLCGELAAHSNNGLEVVIYFSKPFDIQYEPFRISLSAFVQRFYDEFGALQSSVWQRKLGLGSGKEYIARLRISGDDKQLSAIGRWLSSVQVEDFVRKSVVEGGKLAIKELLF